MMRNKITALLLSSALFFGSAVNTYADTEGEDAMPSFPAQTESVREEVKETDDLSDPAAETEPTPEPDQTDTEYTEAADDSRAADSVSGYSEEAADAASDTQTESETTASDDAAQAAAEQAANETQAAQQTVGIPGVQAPDLSWVSPAGVRGASYAVAEKAADETDAGIISDAVRKEYKKVDPSYALALKDSTPIYESRSTEARTVGTIAEGGVMNVLKTKASYLYVESLNVRGYVRCEDVLTGPAVMEHVQTGNLSKLPKAETLVELEENAAADDFKVTAYQFTEANGEDVVKYAKRHSDTVYNEEGTVWESGLDNIHFIQKVYSFYNLDEAGAADESYADFGETVSELSQTQAGDLFILDNGELCICTGQDSVLLCSEEEKGFCEKSIHDVLVVSMHRPDYGKQLPEEEEESVPEDTLIGATVEEQCWNYLTKNVGLSEIAAAGAMGNLMAECGFQTGNLENWVNALMNCSDEQFTAACDTGIYSYGQFLDDRYTYPNGNGSQWGYGLIGFTSRSAKAVLWANTVAMGRSLSDLKGQLDAVAQIYGDKLFWISFSSVEQAAADWFYYVGMGNPLGGTNGYGYEYTIPDRQAYAADFYARFHS